MTKMFMAMLVARRPDVCAPRRNWLIHCLVWFCLLTSASGASASPPTPCPGEWSECTHEVASAAAQTALVYHQANYPNLAPILVHYGVQPGSEFASYAIRWTQPDTHAGQVYSAHYRARTFGPMPENPCGSYSAGIECTRASARAIAERILNYHKERAVTLVWTISPSFDEQYRFGSFCVRNPNGCYHSVHFRDPLSDQDADLNVGEPNTCLAAGNPINCGTGNKFQKELDLQLPEFEFVRYYNSDRGTRVEPAFGPNWTHTFSRQVVRATVNGADTVKVLRPQGNAALFTESDGSWQTSPGSPARLVEAVDEQGATSGWTFTAFDARETEYYDAKGRLVSIVRGDGRNLSIEYNNGLLDNTLNDFKISRITAASGRTLKFEQDPLLRISRVTAPDGSSIEYTYDTAGRLASVKQSGEVSRSYLYNESALTAGTSIRWALTGIMDGNGSRFATFGYDATGKAVRTEYHDGNSRYTVAYPSPGLSVVTAPDGAQTEKASALFEGVRMLVSTRTTCTGCVERTSTISRNSQGNVESAKDENDISTEMTYDTEGRMISKIEAANQPVQDRRLTQVDWHPDLWAPVARFTRDGQGNLLASERWTYGSRGQFVTQSAVDPATETERTTVLNYCEASDVAEPASTCPILGLLKAVDGPRTDVSDLTTYLYRSADDLGGCETGGNCHRKGDLWRMLLPDGSGITIDSYDMAGRVKRIVDMNGVSTLFEYDARGRMTASKVLGSDNGTEIDDAITRIEYDGVGQVLKVTQPDGSYVLFTYDNAHRLTGVEDALGNTVTYSLDGAGNRFEEKSKDSAGVLRSSLTRLFNQLGELETAADAYASPTDFTYDLAGQVDTITDALGRTAEHGYDALGRLRRSIANVGGTGAERAETQFEYDALDRMVTVVDPKGLTTAYTYDGLGDLIELASPDTGTATFTHDSAGNRIGQLDARGVQTYYSYDSLNRLTGIDLPTPGQDLRFGYDTAPAVCESDEQFPVGRLAGFTDPSGTTDFCYDGRGNVVRKVQTASGGPTRTVRYQYNAADREVAITYPSGLVLSYTRNVAGQITAVTAQNLPNEAPVELVTDASYLPFGPLANLTFANGRVLSKAFDLNYGIASVTDNSADGLAIDYSLDDIGNVVGLEERQNDGAGLARTVDYDGLDRLTTLNDGSTPVQAFTYDATGNRTSKSDGAATPTAYQYAADSHRLTQVGSQNRVYDAAGNSTTIHARNYVYDDRGRMQQSRNGTTVLRDYRYNALGQRVAKLHPTLGTSSVYYVYNEAGQLLGEYKPDGTTIREYLWLDDTLVAVRSGYAGHKFQYVLTDHLNTPRAIVLPATNAIIWRWDLGQSAFGDHAAQNNPDGDSFNYVFNLRYPGQYYDGETGLHYNYFRDYDPSTGRYVQSDPIGLGGGLSTYAYVDSTPFVGSDPLGLFRTTCDASVEAMLLCNPGAGQSLSPVTRAVATAGTGSIAGATLRSDSQAEDCPDKCQALVRQLRAAMQEVNGRAEALRTDRCGFYIHAKNAPNPALGVDCPGSWDGHLHQLSGWQNRVKNLIDQLRKEGCEIPFGAYGAGYLRPPSMPRGY